MTHDKLQAEAFQWAHNTFPQVRGRLFAALNEIKPIKGESKVSHMQRISHAKSIGLQKGVLDLLFLAPARYGHGIETTDAHVYGFDAKIKPDKIHDKQIDFVDILNEDGGNGYPFYTLDEFKAIFINIIRKHYGAIN